MDILQHAGMILIIHSCRNGCFAGSRHDIESRLMERLLDLRQRFLPLGSEFDAALEREKILKEISLFSEDLEKLSAAQTIVDFISPEKEFEETMGYLKYCAEKKWMSRSKKEEAKIDFDPRSDKLSTDAASISALADVKETLTPLQIARAKFAFFPACCFGGGCS